MIQWFYQSRRFHLWLRLIGLMLIVAGAALFAGWIASKANPFGRWILGLGFAIGVGQIACPYFLYALRDIYMRLPKPRIGGVPPSVVGVSENVVFVIAVGASYANGQRPEWVFTVMTLWLAAKMLAGWNRDDSIVVRDQPDWDRRRWSENRARGAASALLAGVLNLALATAGGNIAAGETIVAGGVYGAEITEQAFDWIMDVWAEMTSIGSSS